MPRTPKTATALNDSVSAELKQTLRALKLGKMLDTLPEGLALARTQQLPYADFLELLPPLPVPDLDAGEHAGDDDFPLEAGEHSQRRRPRHEATADRPVRQQRHVAERGIRLDLRQARPRHEPEGARRR